MGNGACVMPASTLKKVDPIHMVKPTSVVYAVSVVLIPKDALVPLLLHVHPPLPVRQPLLALQVNLALPMPNNRMSNRHLQRKTMQETQRLENQKDTNIHRAVTIVVVLLLLRTVRKIK